MSQLAQSRLVIRLCAEWLRIRCDSWWGLLS